MNDWYNCPEPNLDPPEPKPVFNCDDCGEGIYPGANYWAIDGHRYCQYCIEDAKRTAEEEDGDEDANDRW